MVNNGVKLVRCGDYIAASDGKIYKLNYGKTGEMREIKQSKDAYGYLVFEFNKKTIRSHRFVAMCFIPNPNNLPEINHKNEIKTDNRVENLEWCDRKYNINYGCRTNKAAKSCISHPSFSRPVIQFTKSGNIIAKYPSGREAERQTGVDASSISSCCKGKLKTAGGCVWRHAD